jgi:hypothetical protein
MKKPLNKGDLVYIKAGVYAPFIHQYNIKTIDNKYYFFIKNVEPAYTLCNFNGIYLGVGVGSDQKIPSSSGKETSVLLTQNNQIIWLLTSNCIKL